MWVSAGLEPDAFWNQTLATFQAIMAGVRKRLEREAEASIRQAYDTARFSAAAQVNKLGPLDKYLRKTSGQKPSEMLAVLKAIRASGADMTIRRVERE